MCLSQLVEKDGYKESDLGRMSFTLLMRFYKSLHCKIGKTSNLAINLADRHHNLDLDLAG